MKCGSVDNTTYLISTILVVNDNLGKFDPKLDKGTFLGYFDASKAYKVYNSRTLVVEEFIHATFNDYKPNKVIKVEISKTQLKKSNEYKQ
ncbi:hypothetical protein CR513_43559, partial [Mucuna pruriens]